MKVGIDIDNTLAAFDSRFPYAVKQAFGVDVQPEHLRYYDLPMLLGVTEKEAKKFFDILCSTFEGIPLLSGAKKGMSRLIEDGHEVIIITNRWERELATSWLKEQGWGQLQTIFLKAGDDMVEIDVMLDDSPKKLAGLLPMIKKEAFLLTQPNNVHCLDILNRFTRVSSWSDFMWHLYTRRF